jgi:hypothetical protein
LRQLLGNSVEHAVIVVLLIERNFRNETSYTLSCMCIFIGCSKCFALHFAQRMSGKKWSPFNKKWRALRNELMEATCSRNFNEQRRTTPVRNRNSGIRQQQPGHAFGVRNCVTHGECTSPILGHYPNRF